MVRITAETDKDRVIWRVEGSLRGPWVDELERAWQSARDSRKHLSLDLEDVSYVDDAAIELLTRIFQDGTELLASGPYMTAIVQEIQSGCLPARSVADSAE
jgi:anti-anti-sigma regulatory factor